MPPKKSRYSFPSVSFTRMPLPSVRTIGSCVVVGSTPGRGTSCASARTSCRGPASSRSSRSSPPPGIARAHERRGARRAVPARASGTGPPPRSTFRSPFAYCTRPAATTFDGPPVTFVPSNDVVVAPSCGASSPTACARLRGSKTTMSASAPGAIVPLRGKRPKIFAGDVRRQLDEAVERDASRCARRRRRPGSCRVSMPGAPLGIFEKSSSPELLLLLHAERAVVGRDRLQVVDARPRHSRSCVAFGRSGGLITYFAPSKPGSS